MGYLGAMLASVLPGVRELRGPLAAGFIWLLSAWLLLADEIPPEETQHIFFQRIYRLSDAVSSIGTGIALGFGAYLVGIVLERVRIHRAITAPVIAFSAFSRGIRLLKISARRSVTFDREKRAVLREQARRMYAGMAYVNELPDEVATALVELVGDALMDNEANRSYDRGYVEGFARAAITVVADSSDEQVHSYDSGDPESTIRRLAGNVLDSIPLIETRLRAESEIYGGEIDRSRAEGEFRSSLVDPLAVLIISVSLVWSPAALLGLIVPVLLYQDGNLKDTQATAAVLVALRSSVLTPEPSPIAQLREEAKRIEVDGPRL